MGSTDFGWVGEIKAVETAFGCNAESMEVAETRVNNLLKEGWRLLAIVNDTKLVIARGGSDLPVTGSYYILGRSGS